MDASGTAKLCDFGIAAAVPVDRNVGTPLFVAPEILSEGRCGTAADLWSFGVGDLTRHCHTSLTRH